jgi:ABC-2 type transport system permease protein
VSAETTVESTAPAAAPVERGGGFAGNVAALVRKEWHHYFGSPIAWVMLTAWTLLFGRFFYVALAFFVRRSMAGMEQMQFGGGPALSLNEWVIAPVLQNMAVVALFVTPMLTMRLFAEEKRQGTIELLSTAPLTDLQIVLGKFLAAASLYALMILAGLVNVALIWHYATVAPEWKPMATGALALLLFGCCFLAVGLFISSLTRNQIVAAILSFCVFLAMWTLGWADDPNAGPVAKVVAYMGITTHLDDLMKGVLAVKDLVFYLSLIVFGLFLAHQSVESQRWRA